MANYCRIFLKTVTCVDDLVCLCAAPVLYVLSPYVLAFVLLSPTRYYFYPLRCECVRMDVTVCVIRLLCVCKWTPLCPA